MPASRRRRAMQKLAHQALRDESGGEVLEYALVAGLVVTAAISTIACVGTKVLGRWSNIDSSV